MFKLKKIYQSVSNNYVFFAFWNFCTWNIVKYCYTFFYSSNFILFKNKTLKGEQVSPAGNKGILPLKPFNSHLIELKI